MDFLIPSAWAQAAPGAPAQPGFSPLILMLVVVAFMYFMMIRPQMKRAKEHRAMLQALAKGDEVIVAGGILGRVDEIGESFVAIEIATDTTIKVQKGAIGAVLPKGTLKSA